MMRRRSRRALTLLEVVISAALTLALVAAMVKWSEVIQTVASAGTARVDAARTATVVSARLGTDIEAATGCDQLRRDRPIASVSPSELVVLADTTADARPDRVTWQIVGNELSRTIEPGTGGCAFGASNGTTVVTDKVKTTSPAQFSLLDDGQVVTLSSTIDCAIQPEACSFEAVRLTMALSGDDGASLRYSDSFSIDNRAFTIGGQNGASGAGTGFTAPAAPTAPTVSAGAGQVLVSWRPPVSDGGAPVQYYEVRALSALGGAPTGVTGASTRSTTAPPFSFSGLAISVPYTFQVRAVNTIGEGSWSSSSASVTVTGGSVATGISGLSDVTGSVGVAVAQTGVPSGGSAPFTWSSSPPMGHSLSLSSTTGVLSGKLGGGVKAVTGRRSPCALLADGSVACWGFNSSGQLGLGDAQDRGDVSGEMGANLPRVQLGTGRTATSLASGDSHTCALLDNRTVKCWGDNSYGQLGLGNTLNRGSTAGQMGDALSAVSLGTGLSPTAISAGSNFSCALLSNGTVKCWGRNNFGQLGLGDTNNRGDNANEMGDNLPTVSLGNGRTAVAISAGISTACALLDNGTIKCWGSNQYGQLGLGDLNDRGDGPNEMGDNLPAVSLGAGRTGRAVKAGNSSCAVLDNYTLKCWGWNQYGQLGLGDTSNRGDGANEMGDNLAVVQLGTGRTVRDIALGASYACALLDNNTLKCWGQNTSVGLLGLGDSADRGDSAGEMGDALPAVRLGGTVSSLWSSVGSGSCTVLTTSQVKCWGANTYGSLGIGSTVNKGALTTDMGSNLASVSFGSVSTSYTISVADASGVRAQTKVTITAIS